MIFKRKDILKHNNSFLKCFNYMILKCETLYLSPANTKQKWLETSFLLACFFSFWFFLFILRYYTRIVRYWQSLNPLIAED